MYPPSPRHCMICSCQVLHTIQFSFVLQYCENCAITSDTLVFIILDLSWNFHVMHLLQNVAKSKYCIKYLVKAGFPSE